METIVKYIQLPVTFAVDKLQAELNALTDNWILHFNKAHYEGDWSALPLRSIGGSMANVVPDNNSNAEFKDTILMDQCPYIKSIVQHFDCSHNATRLLKLKPGAIIKEHTDADLDIEHGEARIHVPITTNPQVEFYLDNERMEVKEGECWYMNFALPHRIANLGTTDRVHLVMDIVVNDDIRAMFDSADVRQRKTIPVKDRFSVEAKQNIIDELLKMNTPASLQLVEQMRAANG